MSWFTRNIDNNEKAGIIESIEIVLDDVVKESPQPGASAVNSSNLQADVLKKGNFFAYLK